MNEIKNEQRTDKPWGHELLFARTDKYAGKLLHIKKGKRLSLQYHTEKKETMYILEGLVELTIGDVIMIVGKKSQSINIKPKTIHRVKALEDTIIIEVSTPELDDIVRLEDDYGRIKQEKESQSI